MFFNYGYALAQDSDKDDAYDYFIIGVEGQRVISEDWLIFAQLGFGDKIKDGNDDREGFNDGYILRAGITNFFSEYTAFTADFELAGSRNHIDSSDPGRFFDVTVGGETRLKTKAPLFVNYSSAYDYIDSTDEGDVVEDITIGIGIKYVFGAGMPRERWVKGIAYGGPRLPVRASSWTEYLD